MVGYAAAWRNTTSTVIGPVVAANAPGARRLIADLAAQVRGPIRLDLDPDGPELPRWALAHGLEPVALNAVMAYGDWSPRGNPDWLHAPISVALA